MFSTNSIDNLPPPPSMLIQPNAVTPTIGPRVNNNAIREGIGITGRDGRNMILVPIHNSKDLQRSFLKHITHRLPDLGSF